MRTGYIPLRAWCTRFWGHLEILGPDIAWYLLLAGVHQVRGLLKHTPDLVPGLQLALSQHSRYRKTESDSVSRSVPKLSLDRTEAEGRKGKSKEKSKKQKKTSI